MSLAVKLKAKVEKYKRVLQITRKPTREEFGLAIKITGAGILLIGAIGFAIYLFAVFTKIFG